jgi:hypothetical protein
MTRAEPLPSATADRVTSLMLVDVDPGEATGICIGEWPGEVLGTSCGGSCTEIAHCCSSSAFNASERALDAWCRAKSIVISLSSCLKTITSVVIHVIHRARTWNSLSHDSNLFLWDLTEFLFSPLLNGCHLDSPSFWTMSVTSSLTSSRILRVRLSISVDYFKI